jgi:histidine triad (HIT) family protein
VACLFCKIVAGDEPAEVVLEDEHVLGFLDVRPVFKGHTLLVPREHVDTLLELPEPMTVPLFAAARRAAAEYRDRLRHALVD